MNRAYSVLSVKEITERDDDYLISGTATTPSSDRMDDVVEPLGGDYKLPLPMLWQHQADKPVGRVIAAKPSKSGIPVQISIPKVKEAGTLKDRIDEAIQSIRYRLVTGLSIGFRALEGGIEVLKNGGLRFTKWEWLELSLVTIPANQEASLNLIKSIDTTILAATGIKDGEGRPVPPGVTGKNKTHNPVKLDPPKEGIKVNIKEQIAALEKKRDEHKAKMLEIQTKASDAGRTKDASEQEEFDTLKVDLASIEKELEDLKSLEAINIKTAAPAAGANASDASQSRTPSPARSLVVEKAIPKGVGMVRMLGARYLAKEYHQPAHEIALSKGWGTDLADALKLPPDIVIKAAVTGGTTTDQSWAGALVTYQNLQNEFIELLRPLTIIGRIPGIRKVPFNIKVPREIGETTAYWVSQGSPKPVSKGALDTVTLDFNKVAGLTFLTKELMRFSTPSAEQVMVNSLTKAITKLTDNDFLDPNKALVSGVSPASITNGVTPITATGNSADAFDADFTDMLAAYTASNQNMNDLVVVMSQTQAMRLGRLKNDFSAKIYPDLNKDGGYIDGIPVITSENIAANGGSPADGRIIVALAASSILMADDGGVEVNVSTEASIQTDDAPDSPQTSSTTLVSMFQTNQVAILCERFITWQKGRSGAAQYITGANYGN
jgi:HK97 family phage major capsid protein/HK97 family phage prohead protease